MGVVLSIRAKECLLSVWNRHNKNSHTRFRIAYFLSLVCLTRPSTLVTSNSEKLKQILNLDATVPMEYKFHRISLHDRSTYRNGKVYNVT